MPGFFKKYLFTHFFKFIYFLGLTLIIPYIFIIELPPGKEAIKSTLILVMAAIFIILGALGVYYNKKSWKKTLYSLGLFTLIPGILSILIIIYEKNFILALFENSVIGLDQLKPLISSYFEKRITSLWIIAVFYILLGIIMFIIGKKMKQ